MDGLTTDECERAVVARKPASWERAEDVEAPDWIERAVLHKPPAFLERDKKRELTEQAKRA